MKVIERYLTLNLPPQQPDFSSSLSLILVIPVLDDWDIFETLHSLSACFLENNKVGVMIVINHSINASDEVKQRNKLLAADIKKYITQHKSLFLEYFLLEAYDLPAKSAGVGAARKIGMDAALHYFYKEKNKNGIIVSLDADTWVKPNYVEEIIHFFQIHKIAGCSISFEHRLSENDKDLKEAIINYELYLRYYRLCMQYIGHPYVFHCIGSAFAVRVEDYAAQGGMNKRQAGEDFYFIQKLIGTGRFKHLSTTKVYPSSRISQRTPFGTGQTVKQIIEDKGSYRVYNFIPFKMLKSFFASIEEIYEKDTKTIQAFFQHLPQELKLFFGEEEFISKIEEINKNTSSLQGYKKRFFDKFNAFQVLKFLNFVHNGFFEKQDIKKVAKEYLIENQIELPSKEEDLIHLFRKLDS